MKLGYLFIILAVTCGCKAASSVAPQPSAAKAASSSADITSIAKDESLQPDNITPNMVMDGALRKNGFTVSREKVTNLSAQPLVIHVTVSSSTYKLFTRIHEQVVMSELALNNLNRQYWKVSNLEIKLSEIFVTHGDGTSETVQLGAEGARFNLASEEAATIAWVARIPADTQICPFYSSMDVGGYIAYSVQLNWGFAGESLQGTLSRSIEAVVQNSDGTNVNLPLVTNLPSALNEASSDWAPRADDRDFGCNGIMQTMN
jgi:hypothetical protein